MSLNDSVIVISYHCYQCHQEMDVLTDHKCSKCESSFVAESEEPSDVPLTEGQPQRPDSDPNRSLVICSICLMGMDEKSETLAEFKCSHQYHKNCIQQWIREQKTCPACRAAIDSPTVTTLLGNDRHVTRRQYATRGRPFQSNRSLFPTVAPSSAAQYVANQMDRLYRRPALPLSRNDPRNVEPTHPDFQWLQRVFGPIDGPTRLHRMAYLPNSSNN